ncbi:hypothetical protein XBO1_690002 [Xenorhabdus bovienii str. oregonense]|uniref:Uncharacterized protein n=1 Tax=Xenorhabdus bovienii str. oregonense TaxID=1398202 RepID=A0A077PAL9_XENBV|nr:hypothetical protein XBO1_690002 [Xenorhabdus bovienii str. oregonense]
MKKAGETVEQVYIGHSGDDDINTTHNNIIIGAGITL